MTNSPSTEERIWAVLSHLSAIAFGMGLLLPVIGWSEQRRKSNYASFHCLQALGYQSLGYTIWFLFTGIIAIIFVIIMLPVISAAREPGAVATWMSIYLVFIFGLFGSYFLLPVVAAVSCALGRDFRYPVMGDRLARYLGYDPTTTGDEPTWLIEDHEGRWVSAMGHISVIIPLWGILAPLTAWILQGKRNLFLKFQSVQTVTYQGLVNVMYVGSGMVYMFGFMIFIVLTGFESGLGGPSSTGVVGLVALMASMLFAMFIILIVPLLHILGQWAGYRVLKGDDYHYPLLGKLVERWTSKNKISVVEESPV